MVTTLLIIHGLVAVVLLGGLTHQAAAACWPAKSKTSLVASFRSVTGARKAARADQGRQAELAAAIERATVVPLETARAATEALDAAGRLRGLVWEMVASDFETGYLLLQTGFRGAMANAAINLPELSGDTRSRLDGEYQNLLAHRPVS